MIRFILDRFWHLRHTLASFGPGKVVQNMAYGAQAPRPLSDTRERRARPIREPSESERGQRDFKHCTHELSERDAYFGRDSGKIVRVT